MSVYQKDISRIFKTLLLKYETQITTQNFKKLDRFSIVELSILDHLRIHGKVTQSALLEILEIKRGKSLGMIKKLADANLLEKSVNEADRRSTFLLLTPYGESVMTIYDTHEAEFLDFVLKDMTINEEKAIVKFLSKINQTDYMK